MPSSRRTISNPASPPDQIADRIVDSILAGRLAAGQRLGEQSLADLFGCSRTLVREALSRLSARGMVEVNARRGWYVVQPSRQEAQEAFDARLAIEAGLVQTMPDKLPATAIKRLRQHVADERAAIRAGEPGERSYLLGDFHVCLAECVGNALLADILRDLTARTTLIATLFQSTHDASRSCADHAEIVAALAAGDRALALQRVTAHLQTVAEHLGPSATRDDPLAVLRSALDLPIAAAKGRSSAADASAADASAGIASGRFKPRSTRPAAERQARLASPLPASLPAPRRSRRLFSDLVAAAAPTVPAGAAGATPATPRTASAAPAHSTPPAPSTPLTKPRRAARRPTQENP